MKTILLVSALCMAPALRAQGYLELPATANPAQELPDYGLPPFAQTNSRVQMFFDATEVGVSNFTVTEVSFRYDGPLPQVGAPGPFLIQRLQISIGTSTVGTPGANFADNLSTPLTSAFDASVSYSPDPGFAAPHPWGAPNGSLTFTFATPVAITIPAGGWLVLDIAMENNNFSMFGWAHTILDGVLATGGPADGQVVAFGQGCSIDGVTPAATIGTAGITAPGAASFVTGQNLGASAPVLIIYGLDNAQSSFGALPYQLPGTSCSLLTSVDASRLTFADANGALVAGQAVNAFVVPADPIYNGLVIYEQLAALSAAANSYGVAFSDAQTLTLGTLSSPGRGTYTVSHGDDAYATVATEVSAFGYAVRLGTQ